MIEFKTKPFDYQLDGIEYGRHNNRWLLADGMGVGKSLQAIYIAQINKEKYNWKHCLIVCGVNSLKYNWYNEVNKHTDYSAYILGTRYKRSGAVKAGSTKEKLEDLLKIDELPYFLITNIESFRSVDFANKIKNLCKNKIKMIIADELHACKNPASQQAKGFLKSNPDYKLAMTGTPLMNSPLDLFIILKWLGYENHSFYQFKQHFCVMGGFGGYQVVGYKHMEQITDTLDTMMLRRVKEDVIDLPDKMYIDSYVDMLPKQKTLYYDIVQQIQEDIDKVILSPSPLASLIRLRQCTGYPGILSTSVNESAKLDKMEEIVKEAVSNGEKCVVFSNWTNVTKEVCNRLKEYNTATITGEVKDVDRIEQEKKFMEEDACKVIVGTIGAMGTGLTLTAGTVVIFMDEPWNSALFEQAVDRTHRIGTTKKVTVYSIMCKDTIDERIHELIYQKGKISEILIDGVEEKNKTELVNFLLS